VCKYVSPLRDTRSVRSGCGIAVVLIRAECKKQLSGSFVMKEGESYCNECGEVGANKETNLRCSCSFSVSSTWRFLAFFFSSFQILCLSAFLHADAMAKHAANL
jgi:hypothetical protein